MASEIEARKSVGKRRGPVSNFDEGSWKRDVNSKHLKRVYAVHETELDQFEVIDVEAEDMGQ